MSAIETYVYIDLETSGLPCEENNKTKITELSLVAVKRQHILDTRVGCSPRVQHKLTLCFNPGRMINPDGSKITGLCNDLLEREPYFNMETYKLISTFLSILTKPVCLIAQNGNFFDFPILRNHFDKLGVSLSEDLLCADCYHGFYDILEGRKKVNNALPNVETVKQEQTNLGIDEIDLSTKTNSFQDINEKTPKRQMIKSNNITPQKNRLAGGKISKARRRFPWSEGLLFLTGMLWGCTNPFIRQGTRGLRKVKSNTKLGQTYAEITFLLGNWRYVLPWLINQTGSLVYLAAVQRVPLSLAVPAANSLAFAFTAITGSTLGAEEPLNSGSILGVVLIGVGTALCCWDKTD